MMLLLLLLLMLLPLLQLLQARLLPAPIDRNLMSATTIVLLVADRDLLLLLQDHHDCLMSKSLISISIFFSSSRCLVFCPRLRCSCSLCH